MIKVILKACEIPLGSTVTKRTGETPYILTDRITVYNEDKTKTEIPANDCFFLVSTHGTSINAIGVKTELVWQADEHDLMEFLDPPEDK